MGKKRNRYKSGRTKRKRILRDAFGWVLGLSLFIVGIPLLSAAFANSYYALLDASWPQIKEIEIKNTKHVQRDEALNVMGVPRGGNLFNVRAAQLARRLESLSWIRSAIVRIDLSGRVVVDVTEREPLAVVHTTDFFLLDTEGKLFLPAHPAEYPDLLLVTGFADSDLKDGRHLQDESLRALKDLVKALEKVRDWFPPRHISECHWQETGGITLYTTQGGIPIELGSGDFDGKLARLNRIFAVLMDRQCLDEVTRIDIDYPNRAYVEGHFPTPKGI